MTFFDRLRCHIVLLLCVVGPLGAQTPTPQLPAVERAFDFYSRGPYRNLVPRPSQVLGYEPGAFYANYGALERLLREYETKADRLRVFSMGVTAELRPMHLLAISSPANLERLDAIKAANRRLADPRETIPPAELEQLIRQQPIIVWLGYNIHGDEAAGTEAAMQVLYQLLDSDEPALRTLLDQTVVLMNPCQNPDGRERFVTWYNAHGIGRPETFAFEKENPWNVQGRFNHFYFDLNRDMLVTSQPESRNSAAAFLDWLPQIAADHHGETKEYFFPPAALPINPNLPRPTFETWLDRFGRGNAAAFDEHGWLFYVRDVFDVFYPGYWDSWPSLQGATGMTYETSGGGKLGRNHRRDDQTIMTLRAAIAKHFTASLATLATAVEHREARLRDFRQHFVDALAAGRTGELQQIFLPLGRDPQRTVELVRVLLRSGIEVRRATQEVTVPAARDYLGGAAADRTLAAGTYVVDLAQPRGRVAKALLERETPQDPEFITRQEEKRARNRARGDHVPDEDYEFYDITAWTLPLMFGVDAWFTGTPATVVADPVTEATAPIVAAPARARSAYVFSPDTEGGLRLALQLLGEGYRLATAVRPLHAGDREFIRGSFIVRVERNPESLHERLA
ncbi:MAG TPA: M14 family zinc carboxypeptidase, partial [Candidatus Synoicihabitans sp.]|nr:M14 family zinc carboxypeptidase [Candidatus Synoicihabitans sp.]